MKKDFADIPLSNFKEKLFTIVNEEYKKLIPLAYSHLIQAGLAQKNTLKCIEQQVNKKREKTKQAIETKFAILEKQKAGPKDKGDLAETEQVSLQEIIEVLKNWQKSKKTDKDFEAAKSALPPIVKTYEILCMYRGQCGAKTTDIIRWLGSAANDRSGYYPALLENFASPEVIADLEKWQEKPAETEQDTKREREGMIVVRKPLHKKAWAIIMAIIIILGGVWTAIQIYESETFENLFGDFEGEVQIPTEKNTPQTGKAPAIQVTFKSGEQCLVELSIIYRADPEKVPYLVSKYGSLENALSCFLPELESSTLSILEKHTLEESRQLRKDIEQAIFAAVKPQAEQHCLIVESINLGEIHKTR